MLSSHTLGLNYLRAIVLYLCWKIMNEWVSEDRKTKQKYQHTFRNITCIFKLKVLIIFYYWKNLFSTRHQKWGVVLAMHVFKKALWKMIMQTGDELWCNKTDIWQLITNQTNFSKTDIRKNSFMDWHAVYLWYHSEESWNGVKTMSISRCRQSRWMWPMVLDMIESMEMILYINDRHAGKF